jgi:hypothetical protein
VLANFRERRWPGQGTAGPFDVRMTSSFVDRLAILLERWSGRPLLVGVAAMNGITGLAVAAILAPTAFGADADTFRQCASFAAEGRTDCGFL